MAGVNLADNQQVELRITTISLTILAMVFVGLRFASRLIKGFGIGIDDYIILVATFFLIVTAATCLIGIHFGLGKHAASLTTPEVVSYAKSLISFECLYVTCVCFTKISLLLMYLRIFPVRSIRLGAYILGALSISWCISIVMVSIFQCTPIEKIWNPTLAGHCINLKKSFVGNAIPNILTDVAILALPMQQVWSLQTKVLQKVQISFVFLLGSFVVFTSIYRFTTLFRFQASDITCLYSAIIGTLATAQVWCVVESAAGIISACLPTLGTLFQVTCRKLGLTSGLTLSSRARTPSAGTQLQQFGGSHVAKKGSGGGAGTYDGSRNKSVDARPFRRLSGVSGISDEEDWATKTNMRSSVRVHDLESAKSVGSDEIPLHKIVVKAEIDWSESASRKAGSERTGK